MAWPFTSGTATIANGESLSDGVGLGGDVVVGIIMPAAWTAADLSFQGSIDGTNYFDVYTEQVTTRTEKTLKAAASDFIAVSPSTFAGLNFIKVRSGTAAAAVNQGAQRLITLQRRGIA